MKTIMMYKGLSVTLKLIRLNKYEFMLMRKNSYDKEPRVLVEYAPYYKAHDEFVKLVHNLL